MDNPGLVMASARTSKRHYAMLLLLAVLFAGLFYTGYRPWKERQNRLFASTKVDPELVVGVAKVTRSAAAVDLILPAALSAVRESPIYARAEGYIKTRKVDIGDRVKAGQLLVEIDTPELDEQLRQARYRYNQFKAQSGATQASLVQAKANLELANVTLRRTEKLVQEGVFSKQEYDNQKAVYDVRAAEVASAQANVEAAEEGKKAVNSDIERLTSSTTFQKVTAPFDGIITSRTCEVGNLINATSANGRELFRIADPKELRALVNVPQPNSPSVTAGMRAEITVPEYPGRIFAGRVTRTALALDASSRTMLTQVGVESPAGVLMPGMFVDVKLVLQRTDSPLTIPGDTAVLRPDGTYAAAAVDASGTVHFRKLIVGRDLGSQVEILSGLTGDERLVVNPTDDIKEGVHVRVADEKAK